MLWAAPSASDETDAEDRQQDPTIIAAYVGWSIYMTGPVFAKKAALGYGGSSDNNGRLHLDNCIWLGLILK